MQLTLMRVRIKSRIGMRVDIKLSGHIALAERKVIPSLPIHSCGDVKSYYLQLNRVGETRRGDSVSTAAFKN